MTCTIEPKEGFCDNRKQWIPLAFCKNKCKYRKEELPSMATLGMNFSKALLKHITSGFKNRPQEEQQKAMAICRSNQCGKFVIVNEKERCADKRCGCFLNVKKRWASADCPEGRWGKEICVLRCSDNSAPHGVLEYCLKTLNENMPYGELIQSQKPPEARRWLITYYHQIISAAKKTKAKNIFLCEHDVLYHPSHFDFVPSEENTFYYNSNLYICANKGYVSTGRTYFSQCVCNRLTLIKALEERIAFVDGGGSLTFCEPGIADPITKFNRVLFRSKIPSVDIRHGNNLTGNNIIKDSPNESYFEMLDYWGSCKELRKKMEL